MKTIEISDDILIALDDRLDPDIKTHDDVICGMLDFEDALIEQNARLKAELARVTAERDAALERARNAEAKLIGIYLEASE